jgi:hypothetical protein
VKESEALSYGIAELATLLATLRALAAKRGIDAAGALAAIESSVLKADLRALARLAVHADFARALGDTGLLAMGRNIKATAVETRPLLLKLGLDVQGRSGELHARMLGMLAWDGVLGRADEAAIVARANELARGAGGTGVRLADVEKALTYRRNTSLELRWQRLYYTISKVLPLAPRGQKRDGLREGPIKELLEQTRPAKTAPASRSQGSVASADRSAWPTTNIAPPKGSTRPKISKTKLPT